MSLAKLFVEVGADVGQFQRGLHQVRSDMDRTAKQASFLQNTLSTAIGTGVSMAVAKATSSITEFVGFIKKTGEEFNSLKENSTLAFETMLGSIDQAKSFLGDLQQFAEKTPFELPGLIDSSQKMIAFGFTAKSVIPTLTSIGDAVSGLGGSPEKLQRVITAIGQIKAKGKVQAQEMLQLAEAGIPAWDMLAKAIGKTIPEAMKLSENGAIDAATAINALIKGMNERFGGLMAKQAKTFTGLRSTFNDLLRDVAARVTKPWFDNAKKGLERMIQIMQSDKFQQFINQAIKASEKAATVVSNIKHNIFDFIGNGFNFFHAFFGNSKDATKAFNVFDVLPNKIKRLITYIKPVGDFIYKIADKGFRSFTSMFDDFYRSFNKINNQRFYFFGNMSLEQFSSGIKAIFNDIRSGGKNLNYWLYQAPKVFQTITRLMLNAKTIFTYFSGEGLQATLKKLGSMLTGLGSILAKLVRPFKEALGGLFQQLATMKNLGFSDIFSLVLKSIGQAFTGFIKVIKEEFWPTIKGALVWVWNALSAFVTTINWSSVWDTVTDVFTGLYQFVTNINWSAVSDTVVALFNTIVNYVSSFDWPSIWSSMWSGLGAINDFLKSTVAPAIGNFFDWLLSWFYDPSKSTLLYNAVVATWTFVADWASVIWAGVSPHLSNFFGYLSSWFTDSTKRSQLWNGIVATWNFVTEWALSLWNWVAPYLSNFFSGILSWFTDSSKRSQLWNGIVTTWSFVLDWAKSLWNWISPYLFNFFNYLLSWVTDPTKSQQLINGISTAWNGFVVWSSGLWNSMLPFFNSTDTNIETWIETNKPELQPWYQSIKDFLIPTKEDWVTNFDKMKIAVSDLVTTLKTEIPKIGDAINEMYQTLFGASEQTTWLDWVTYAIENVSYKIKMVVTQVRIVLDMINLINEGWSRIFSGDFSGYAALSGQWNDLLNQFLNSFSMPAPTMPGFATGGITDGGLTVVGERGAEIAQLPRGTRIWDHGQSMGMLDQVQRNVTTETNNVYNNVTNNQEYVSSSRSSKLEIVIRNEGKLDVDRNAIDQIAVALQRKLNLQGNRLVFT